MFQYGGCPKIGVDYYLTDKEVQMFKKIFKYDNPSELKNTIMDADEKEYYELKNNIKTT